VAASPTGVFSSATLPHPETPKDSLGWPTACDDDPRVSPSARSQTIYRAALIVAAKGGMLNDIVVGDVVELLDAQIERRISPPSERMLLYRLLYQLGIFAPGAPATLRALRTAGQRSPEELIDRYHLNCRPVRDLLVDYLRERQPALDYSSLVALSTSLGKLFWADLERHHPGIDSLHLSTEVSVAWKLRLRTIKKTVTGEGGGKAQVAVERINYRECLTPVRAFYLDLAHWAVEDPGRWGIWVTPCPIGEEEINRKKSKRRRKSRMDARTRERLPVLPVVVRSVLDRRTTAEALLEAGRRALPGEALSAPGTELVRSVVDPRSGLGKVWVHDSVEGADRRDLARDEDHAFWAWAAVEVLRATGVRVEELLEISHHAVVQYRLPNTGEVIPLLQIVPSKTDTERLLVVSPELAEVLGAIISRVSDESGTIPSVPFYDRHERVWLAPAPMLFQWRVRTENRAISPSAVRTLLTEALAHTGLTDADGEALRYTPHDFRRIMITDAIMNGLPPHIAQVIAGHHDINVTMGYKAVYPEEAIQAHFAFMARRRSLRPSEEYRTPTDEEWQEFLGHPVNCTNQLVVGKVRANRREGPRLDAAVSGVVLGVGGEGGGLSQPERMFVIWRSGSNERARSSRDPAECPHGWTAIGSRAGRCYSWVDTGSAVPRGGQRRRATRAHQCLPARHEAGGREPAHLSQLRVRSVALAAAVVVPRGWMGQGDRGRRRDTGGLVADDEQSATTTPPA